MMTSAQGDGELIADLSAQHGPLFGNYMAASFVTKTDGHGGSVVTETAQGSDQPHLTNPHHG